MRKTYQILCKAVLTVSMAHAVVRSHGKNYLHGTTAPVSSIDLTLRVSLQPNNE